MNNILLKAHPKLDIILDTEGVGGGSYRKDATDPDRCNATATNIIVELEKLKVYSLRCNVSSDSE